MAIFSLCCDLKTGSLVWAPRKSGTDESYTRLSTPYGISAVSIAGQYADVHQSDVKRVTFS